MKKILASLASLAIIGSSVTSVVSCGPITFAKLMARTVAKDVYYGTYKAPISNWSSAVTMQLEDAIILTNAQDTLLATDQHNNFEGDLADAWTSNEESKTWYFHVRENDFGGHWTSLNQNGSQKDEGKIQPLDFFNTFRFVFNPNNMSQVVGSWQSALKYADELNDFINNIRDDGKDGNEVRPPHPLYNVIFTKQSQDDIGTYKSSYYLDRAILAFNWKVTDPTIQSQLEEAVTTALSSMPNDELIRESFTNGQIINDGHNSSDAKIPGTYNLAYNLKKPISYFEAFAAFLSFAPIPDVAVNYLKSELAGGHYGAASKDGKFGYQNIWYSGAYVVNSYNPTLKIGMVQNNFYFNKNNLSVKKLNYAYIGNVDASRQRKYFETGDISEVGIQPTDLSGWDRYVGTDYKKPLFEGANLVSRPQASTYAMMYNYNSTVDNDSNIALAQRSTTAFIRYMFDRSKVASYYSKAMDNRGGTSATVRNTWTSKNVAAYKQEGQPDKDYVKYLESDYYLGSSAQVDEDFPIWPTVSQWLFQALEKYGLTSEHYDEWKTRYGTVTTVDEQEQSALVDGYDGYLGNDLLGALVFTNTDRLTPAEELQPKNETRLTEYAHFIGQYDQNSKAEKIRLMKDQVRDDLAQYGINRQVNLTWLADGSKTSSLNNYIKDGVRAFDEAVGDNSPIKITVVESSDYNDFVAKQDVGAFSIVSSGWVPDYNDPYNFLHTIVADGDLSKYTGFARLFTRDQENKLVVRAGISTPQAYEVLSQKVQYFSDQLEKIDQGETETNARYIQLAQIENYGVIEAGIVEPLLLQALDAPPFISYVNPFTRSTFTSGQAIYRFVGVEMIPQLWDHKIYKEKEQEYNDEIVNGYRSMYPDENGDIIPNFDGVWNKNQAS